MELIYLWVEKYKNIENEGFNLSPRFKCEFKNGELTIEKKEYTNIFPKNINVSAVIGKNGSGKSTIIKLILFLIFCKNFKNDSEYPIGTLVYILKQFSDKELFLLIYTDGCFKKIAFSSFIRHLKDSEFFDNATTKMMTGSYPIQNEILPAYDELPQNELTFFTFYLNYMTDTLNDGYHDNWINQIYHKKDEYKTPLLIQPNKHNTSSYSDNINLYMIDSVNQQRLILLYRYITVNQKITSFFDPNYIKIKNNFIDHFRVNMSNSDFVELSIIKKVANKLNILLHKKEVNCDLDNKKIPVLFKEIEDNRNFKYMNLLYLVFKLLVTSKEYFNQEKYDTLEKNILDKIMNNELPSENELISYNFKEYILDDYLDDYRVKKILQSIEFEKNKTYNNSFFKLLMNDKKVLIKDIKDILEKLPPWIDIVFYKNNISFESLSSGEKAIFRTLIDIVYQIQKVKVHYNTINIILDETELGLHPQWQKEYLKDILETVALHINENLLINLVFTTHSPFILSDLPKENVIFLKDGRQIYPEIETFGSNIHTLLSHGFFMENGHMGDFAKEKINQAYNFITKRDTSYLKSLKEVQDIINIIGEPLIKKQLQNLFDETFENKHSNLEDEIKILEKKLKVLKELQDESD
ncbi:AAA family ATPase [Poseidonibacter lekithochrous]|uniref:AAA family ATPase n=1 Tax=Poseidonibacter lekithochrous TaxID=1904463 RepID=UPI0008FCA868|nr:AAA family ATPase [Poseidonibacter lekithochrous]QKJ22304.1 hypothetical protein ALEK_1024 [Poseidonibacter lekithochrous]